MAVSCVHMRRPVSRMVEDGLVYAPHRWKWLDRIRRWLYSRLTKVSYREEYQLVSIDEDKIGRIISESQSNFRRFWDAKGGIVYLGPREFFRLHEDQERTWMPLTMGTNMRAGFGGETRFLGITVKMLPWMEGILMVPNEQKGDPLHADKIAQCNGSGTTSPR